MTEKDLVSEETRSRKDHIMQKINKIALKKAILKAMEEFGEEMDSSPQYCEIASVSDDHIPKDQVYDELTHFFLGFRSAMFYLRYLQENKGLRKRTSISRKIKREGSLTVKSIERAERDLLRTEPIGDLEE